MKMQSKKTLGRAAAVVAVALVQSAIHAGTSTNNTGPIQQGQSDGGTGNPALNNPAVTISFSGQTALRNFNTSGAFTELQPGTSIILHDGTSGAPITYTATNTAATNVQLGSNAFSSPDSNVGTPALPSTADNQLHSAIRLEWHEQGSVDGFYDLINDQIGYVSTPISNPALRGPSSSNPTWINTNKFTSGTTLNGFVLDNSGPDNLADTYNAGIYNQTTGANVLGGQNRIQFSVGENPVEAVTKSGTANVLALPGTAGYGQGNPALNSASTLAALGTKGARQQFQPASVLNESTDKVNPNTPSTNYIAGPWNTAGVNNVTSTAVSASAVTFSANPGTGLARVSKGDAQWLQTTGRLSNGALFNVVARTVNTGQRIVFAANTGVDPSWAVGTNDDGNSTNSTNATAQHSIGSALRFSGKTSGSESAATIGQSRMALGALSISEARGVSSAAPVRALDVNFNDLVDVNPADDANKFARATFNSIISDGVTPIQGVVVPRYQAVLISHYNTIKAPNQTALNNELTAEGINPGTATADQQQIAWGKVQSFDPATAKTDSTPASASVSGIKGDNHGDVAAVLSNILGSVATSDSGVALPTSANNPADGLLSVGYLPAGLLDYTRDVDGPAITSAPATGNTLTQQNKARTNYAPLFTTDSSSGANAQTIGTSSFYGGTGTSNGVAINGNIAINAKDSAGNAVGNGTIVPGGNYLFGNFNQNGVRDYSAVQQSLNAALSLHHVDGAKNSIFTPDGGVTNNTPVPSLVGTPGWVTSNTNTKGDLITLGDFNGDGKFDGQDVYLLAKGASLADSSSTTTLNATAATFSDAVRNPNAVLRKNAALDYIQTNTSNTSNADQNFLRTSAQNAQQAANDPTGLNAFNKFDVNRDGRVTRQDAQIVDAFVGKDYRVLADQLGAVVRTDINAAGTAFVNANNVPLDPTAVANAGISRKGISLVDAELNDTGKITNATTGAFADGTGDSDFKLIHDVLKSQGSLLDGDANFDGTVNVFDFNTLAGDFGKPEDRWSAGDFNFDGKVDVFDFNALAGNFGFSASLDTGVTAADWAELRQAVLVPEPATFGLISLAGLLMARRRERV